MARQPEAVPTAEKPNIGGVRRRRILESALKLFRDRGFHGASIDDIGAAAGVTGPAIYYHFDDKSSVLAAAFVQLGDRLFSGMDEIVGRDDSPLEQLEDLVAFHAALVYELRDVFPVLYQEDKNLPPPAATLASRRRQDFVRYWATPLAQVRPELSRDQAWALAAGAVWTVHSLAYYEHPLGAREAIDLIAGAAVTAMLQTKIADPASLE